MDPAKDKNARASSFLSALRGGGGGGAPAPGGLGGAFGGAAGGGGGGTEAPRQSLQPIVDRLDTMEKRLHDLAKGSEPPAPGEPPRPPSELMLYLQTKMELLERKLQTAQDEAMRANFLLREREELQRDARREVEELFRTVREQGRAAAWDAKLREQVAGGQARIQELEARLRELSLRTVPVQELARIVNEAGGREALEARLRERIREAVAKVAETQAAFTDAPGAASGENFGAPPGAALSPSPAAVPGPAAPADSPFAGGVDHEALAVLMARLADLERQVEEARKERDDERKRREIWEKDALAELAKDPYRWRRSGGADLIVEAAIESLTQGLRERDELAARMGDVLGQIQQVQPGSAEDAVLRSRLAELQPRMLKLQEELDRHMSVVQSWLHPAK